MICCRSCVSTASTGSACRWVCCWPWSPWWPAWGCSPSRAGSSAAAVAGLAVATRDTFNYMTPAGGVRFFSIVRTASRWGERVVSHDATFRVLTRLRVWFWDRLSPLSSGSPGRFSPGGSAQPPGGRDIDAMDHVYLRLITP